MCNVCEHVKRLTLPEFTSFVEVFTEDHAHVAEKLMHTLDKQIKDAQTTPRVTSTYSKPRATTTTTYPRFPVGAGPRTLNPRSYQISGRFSGPPAHVVEAMRAQMARTPVGSDFTGMRSSRPNSGQCYSTHAQTNQRIQQEVTSQGPALQYPGSARSSTYDPHSIGANFHRLQVSSPQGPRLSTTSKQVYDMSTSPRGLALIINNENFRHFYERRGSSVDAANLENMFTYLGFQFRTEKNKTASQMLDILREFSEHPTMPSVSCLAVVILTHGGENDCLFGVDGQILSGRAVSGTYLTKLDIIHLFKGSSCKAMAGKPKLFLLQACRGNEENAVESDDPSKVNTTKLTSVGADNFSTRANDNNNDIDVTLSGADVMNGIGGKGLAESAGVCPTNSPAPQKFLSGVKRGADTADMCFLYASSYGYKAYRMRTNGSPFIQVFTDTVRRLAATEEFRDIFQDIQNQFNCGSLPNNMMTLPDISLQLMKKWYLNPPH